MRLVTLSRSGALGLAAALAVHAADAADDSGGTYTGGEVRVRAVYFSPSGSSGSVYSSAPGTTTYLELSTEFALRSNWSIEADIGTPVDYNLYAKLRIWPNTLTAKYSLLPTNNFRLYGGAGAHVTTFSIQDPGPTDYVSNARVGWVAQVGMEIDLGSSWALNADVRRLGRMNPSGVLGGGSHTLNIDPTLISVGICYHGWR